MRSYKSIFYIWYVLSIKYCKERLVLWCCRKILTTNTEQTGLIWNDTSVKCLNIDIIYVFIWNKFFANYIFYQSIWVVSMILKVAAKHLQRTHLNKIWNIKFVIMNTKKPVFQVVFHRRHLEILKLWIKTLGCFDQ